jgi:microcin C transport system substrate-binding protein
MKLLEQSGLVVRDMQLVDAATGNPMRVEFLLDNPAFEPSVLFYKASLKRLGINAAVRLVDPVQYENRLRQRTSTSSLRSGPTRFHPGMSSAAIGALAPRMYPLLATISASKIRPWMP